jgi:DNA primase
MKAEEYCKSKGWDYKTKGNELNLKKCPLCSDEKSHFFINSDSGAWDCKKCQNSGSLFQLKEKLGDIERYVHPAMQSQNVKKPDLGTVREYHRALLNDQGIQTYLLERGITMDSAKHFGLGLRVDDIGRWLSIPWMRGDECINVKYRTLPPKAKSFEREPGCASILFNENAIKDNTSIIITEGEIDAITVWQHGFKNVVGTTNGAGSFDAEWIDRLSKVKKIYVCYDADEAGQKGAQTAWLQSVLERDSSHQGCQ